MTGAPGLSPAALALLRRREGATTGAAIRAGQGGPIAPLAFPQVPQWAFAALFPDNPVFNLPKRLRLRGEVDPAALRTAIESIASRHEVLRAAFRLVRGEPSQVLLAPRPLDWTVADLRPDPDRAPALLDDHAGRLFSLEEGHLVRGLLVRVAEQEWVLQVVFHHIAFDGWSTTIFFDELGPAYDAGQRGEPPGLPTLPVQYADFAAWQRGTEGSEPFERARGYWRDCLAGCEATIDLATRRSGSPGIQTGRGELIRTVLDPALTASLRRQSAAAGTTVASTLLAGYAVLLGRRAAQESVVVGQVAARRTHVELERLIGTFVTTMPVVARLEAERPFHDLASDVRRASALAHEHGSYPAERIGHLLHPGGVLDRGRVYDAVFNFRSFPSRPPRFATLDVTVLESPRQAALAALCLEISEEGDRIVCDLDYDPADFDAVAARRWADGYRALIEAATARPADPIGALPVMAAPEALAVQAASDGPLRTFEGPVLVHRQFEARVRQHPDAPAVREGGTTVSYLALDHWADALAADLRQRGVGPGAIVGVVGERRAATIAALLATWKAGAAFLPLDPIQPPERLARMATDAGCRLAVALTPVPLPGWPGEWLLARPEPPPPDAVIAPAPVGPDEPERLAYVVFTSGSTGVPKGVMVEHRSLANFLGSMVERHRLGPHDTSLQFASLGFDCAFEEIFAPLVAGGAVALAARDDLLDPARFAALVRTAGVTFAAVTPSLLATLDPATVPGLRELMIMGEAADRDLYRRWAEGRRAWNGYGPTEATIGASQGLVDEAAPVVTIGTPNANTRLALLDPGGRPVPFGTPGEIHIGGTALARGYLGDPALTAERFVADRAGDGRRLYRTGDRGRLLPGWGIEFLGRVDQQVKIRGQRVELGEIETALVRLPGVAVAAVVVRTDGGAPRLIGYVEPAPDVTLDPAALRRELGHALPSYMVPATIAVLPRLPRSANQKVDRRALPEPGVEPRADRTPAPPETGFERELVRIWEGLFARAPIGLDDNFFELGGHSLLGARMIAELEQATGHRLPIATLFSDPTPRGLARILRQGLRHDHSPAVVVVNPEGSRPPFFMVHGDVVGGGFYCRAIAAATGGEVPVYAFPPRSELDDDPPDTVEAIARANLVEVRRIQPHGPYRLGGHCLSGLVAYEMAQQLRAAGERVDLLVMVDTRSGPWRFRRLAPAVRRLVAMTTRGRARRRGREALIMHRLEWLRRAGWGDRIRWAAGYPVRFVRRRLGRAAAPAAVPSGGERRGSAPEARVFAFQIQMGARYCPRPYPDPVVFVNAVAGPDARLEAPRGWQELAPQLDLVAAPTTHLAVVTSHLPGIVAARLAELDARRS